MTRALNTLATTKTPAGLVLSEDKNFVDALRGACAPHAALMSLEFQQGRIETVGDTLNLGAYSFFIVDIDAKKHEALQALQRMMIHLRGEKPVIVITEGFDEIVARWMLQIRVSDFATKPVDPSELIKTCLGALHIGSHGSGHEANITTFLPAAGGVGVTTLALEAAYLMQNNKHGRNSTCIVDLDFQHGSCADYLDIEARLDLSEIEPRPERLDRQLMEVMLTYHSSGVALIAAPNRPAEMRSFDASVVTRLLDLASSHFDNVIIDMPRTWFSWTDDVLLGSNQLFVVTEMTVPGLRHAQRLVAAIEERLSGAAKPQVIVNRFEDRSFGPSLKRTDVAAALGQRFAGTIPNDYRVVREAIDRGVPLETVKPGNAVSTELRKIIFPNAPASMAQAGTKGLTQSIARMFGTK